MTVLKDPKPEMLVLDEIEVRFFPAPHSDSEIDRTVVVESARIMLSVYQAQFGSYPYDEIDIVEWPVTIGGYEFPGIVLIDESLRASGNQTDLEFLLAHELAHQWWFAMVGSDQVNEPWLDEAMANYSVIRYLKAERGESTGDAVLQDWRSRYGERSPQDPPIDSPTSAFTGWDPYRRTVYIQGSYFLDALESEMGEDVFAGFLRDYFDQYQYEISTTQAFVDLAERHSQSGLEGFFSNWLSPGVSP